MPEQAISLSIVELFRHADIVVKGVLLLLLAGSIWSWAVIIEKLRQLAVASRRALSYERRAAAARTAAELWDESGDEPGDRDAGGPAHVVLAAGAAEAEAGSPGAESAGERRDRIERAMRLALNEEMRRLEKRLPFLASLGSAAPFIGLFGTVWGIMRSFAAIASANNTSLAVVAPGIAEALFATAMGLAAAIPAVVAYNHFTVQLGRLAARMNAFIGRAGALLSRTAG
jgi:biopolymer transport protein TolQ